MKFNINTLLLQTKRISYRRTSYNLNGSRITDVTTEKDLGVHISSTLLWNDHIDLIVSRATKMLGPGGKVSPRKSVVHSACQYDVTSRVGDFQNGKQSVHRRDG